MFAPISGSYANASVPAWLATGAGGAAVIPDAVRNALGFLVASIIGLGSACGGASAKSPPLSTRVSHPSSTADRPAPTAAATQGPTAADTVAWVLATMATGGKLTNADVESRFAPSFLAEVPVEKTIEVFAMLAGQLGEISVVDQQGDPPLRATALLKTAVGGTRLVVGMTASTPRQIETLLFQPESLTPPPKTYEEVEAALAAAGAKSQFFVAEIDGGRCKPRRDFHGEERMAIGSTFKLWVLLALDDKLRRDPAADWNTPLAFRDLARSFPAGELDASAPGAEHSLREFAEKMIAVSDNTATDHLIDYLGRDQVERSLKLARHSAPTANQPFLRTREMFVLKLATSPDELTRYKKAKPAAKRRLLDEWRGRTIDVEVADKEWNAPRHLDLEWFATGADVCRVLAELGRRDQFDPDADALKVLSANPGVALDAAQWTYVGFKGGSEPGVMHLSWLLRRADGKWFSVVAAVNDPTHPLDENTVAITALAALKILGAEAPAPGK